MLHYYCVSLTQLSAMLRNIAEIITLRYHSHIHHKVPYLSQWFPWFRPCFVRFVLLGLSRFYSKLCCHHFRLRSFIPCFHLLSFLHRFYIFSLGRLLLLWFFGRLLHSKCSAEELLSVHLQSQTDRWLILKTVHSFIYSNHYTCSLCYC